MRVILIFILALTINYSFCQPFQFNVTLSGNYEPSPILVGQNSELTLTFCNLTFLTLPQNPIPAGGVYILIGLGAGYQRTSTSPFDRDDPLDPNDILAASLFTWSPTPSGGWYGVSNTPINSTSIQCGKIIVQVQGISANNNAASTFDATIVSPNSDAVPSNNGGSASLRVNNVPLPINLTSFKAISDNCGTINLEWETYSERNNDYMEVLRSIDGIEFLALGRVSGTNTDSRTSRTYSVVDNFNLKDSQKYYYRLKQVDFDGRSELFEIISAVNHCDENKSLSLFPNPAIDRINLEVRGVQQEDLIKIVLINASGERLRTFYVKSKELNAIDLRGLPGGIYNIQTLGMAETLNSRFIKID
jgi:hypothetical protein